MGLGFKTIRQEQDPNGGRVDINYNFSLLSGVTSINLTGFTSGGTTFDITSGSSANGLITLTTSGGNDINISVPKVSNRVISGFTAASTGDTLQIIVSGGSYALDGTEYTISSATTLNITSGLTQEDRIDAILGNSSPGIYILSGTPGANPTFPTIPDSDVLITYISVPGQGAQGVFNGDREVKRSGLPAVNAGGTTLEEWVENYFFPFIPATLAINSHSLQEIGSTYSPSITYNITLNDETTVTAGRILNVTSGSTIYAVPSPAADDTFAAADVTTDNTWRNEADVDNNGSPETIQSSSSSVSFIYPWFYGMDADASLSGTDVYSNLTKSLQNQGTKTPTFNGSDEFIYIFTPASWADIDTITDQNGFNVTASFDGPTLTNVASSGLDNDYSLDFKMYKTQTVTTVNSGTYTITF